MLKTLIRDIVFEHFIKYVILSYLGEKRNLIVTSVRCMSPVTTINSSWVMSSPSCSFVLNLSQPEQSFSDSICILLLMIHRSSNFYVELQTN